MQIYLEVTCRLTGSVWASEDITFLYTVSHKIYENSTFAYHPEVWAYVCKEELFKHYREALSHRKLGGIGYGLCSCRHIPAGHRTCLKPVSSPYPYGNLLT